jgi:hypothetical protein
MNQILQILHLPKTMERGKKENAFEICYFSYTGNIVVFIGASWIGQIFMCLELFSPCAMKQSSCTINKFPFL